MPWNDENNGLSPEAANAIYDVLVEHAGEIEDEWSRETFVHAQTSRHCHEYRFMGALGFGGKFWREDFQRQWRVNCYAENENERTRKIIAETNKALDEVYARFH